MPCWKARTALTRSMPFAAASSNPSKQITRHLERPRQVPTPRARSQEDPAAVRTGLGARGAARTGPGHRAAMEHAVATHADARVAPRDCGSGRGHRAQTECRVAVGVSY